MHFPGDNNDSPVDIDSRLEDVCLNLIKYLSEGLKKKKTSLDFHFCLHDIC